MSRTKSFLVLLLTVGAVSAVAASSASAFVVEECANVGAGNGTYKDSHCNTLGGVKEFEWVPIANETLTLGESGLTTLKTKISGLEIDAACTKSKSTGHIRSNGLGVGETNLEGCQLYETKSGTLICAIPNIVTRTHGELVGSLATPEGKATPAAGEDFTTVSLAGCPKTFPKSVEIKGLIICQLPEATVGKEEHEGSCTEADKGLTLGKEEAFLIGKGEGWLQSRHFSRVS